MLQGHLICFCARSEVSHFFKEDWLHWVFIASVVVITFQWTELGNICSVFKIKCIMIMLILLVQIQDSQVFINYHKLQAMSFYIYHSNSTKDHNQQHNYQKQLKIFFPLEVLAITDKTKK